MKKTNKIIMATAFAMSIILSSVSYAGPDHPHMPPPPHGHMPPPHGHMPPPPSHGNPQFERYERLTPKHKHAISFKTFLEIIDREVVYTEFSWNGSFCERRSNSKKIHVADLNNLHLHGHPLTGTEIRAILKDDFSAPSKIKCEAIQHKHNAMKHMPPPPHPHGHMPPPPPHHHN